MPDKFPNSAFKNFMDIITPYVLKHGNRQIPFSDFVDIMMVYNSDNKADRYKKYRFIDTYFSLGNSLVSTSGAKKQRKILLDQAILFVYLTETNPETLRVELIGNLFRDI